MASLFSHSVVSISVLACLATSDTAFGQSSSSAYTFAVRYDMMERQVGSIAPDPDSGDMLKYAATRTTYDARGNVVKVETGELSDWKNETIAPSAWGTSFTVLSSVETTYDVMNRKTKDVVTGENGAIASLTQYNYDTLGRLQCTAVRMNSSLFSSPEPDVCALGIEGAQGPDRISKNIYDNAGQLLTIQRAVGTPVQQNYATYTYTQNGRQASVADANANKAAYTYDGHDRLVRWNFPNKTSAGSTSSTDYESYTYDDNGNPVSLRKRDGSIIQYQYDGLNRVRQKIVPERSGLSSIHSRDVFYQYDLRGLQIKARFDSLSGPGVDNAYDGFGRMISSTNRMGSTPLTLSYEYDKNGSRTKVTHPDNKSFLYSYDGLNRVELVQENGSPPVNLKSYSYNQRGLRDSESDANGVVATSSYDYDPIGRVTDLDRDLSGSSNDISFDFTYNPASQMKTRQISNNLYATTAHYNVDRNYAVNGLNQYTTAGPATFTYDDNGNLTGDGTTNFIYDIENRLVAASGGETATLTYDPLGRLYETVGSTAATTKHFLYDGDALVAEYNGSGIMLDRYVHGRGIDNPIIWYNGATIGSTTRRHLQNNWQGSVIAIQNSTGGMVQANGYDDYGIPNNTNLGRFQYTGQIHIPELGMYYYKARIYSPTLGRFLQTDPIGYEDNVNLYGYVGNDPINFIDPTGESCAPNEEGIGVECTLDNPGKLTQEQVEAIEVIYTATVNELLTDRSTVVKLGVDVGEGVEAILETTAGEIADDLIDAVVTYAGVHPNNRNITATHRPGAITLYKKGITRGGDALASTFVHEGAHGTRASEAFARENMEIYGVERGGQMFNAVHQRSFRSVLKRIRAKRRNEAKRDTSHP